MESTYLNDWEETKLDGLKGDFGITDSDLDGVSIILASYLYEDYSGSAYVLFERDGKLWIVEGGHCSCYGLSDSDYSGNETTQWQPEETTIESLQAIIDACGDPFVGGKDVVIAYLAEKAAQ